MELLFDTFVDVFPFELIRSRFNCISRPLLNVAEQFGVIKNSSLYFSDIISCEFHHDSWEGTIPLDGNHE